MLYKTQQNYPRNLFETYESNTTDSQTDRQTDRCSLIEVLRCYNLAGGGRVQVYWTEKVLRAGCGKNNRWPGRKWPHIAWNFPCYFHILQHDSVIFVFCGTIVSQNVEITSNHPWKMTHYRLMWMGEGGMDAGCRAGEICNSTCLTWHCTKLTSKIVSFKNK